MSLRPHALELVPEETARVARAAFPKGHPYLLLRDTLGTIFRDENFATCFPLEGQPGLSPWRLALITISSSAKISRIARPRRQCGLVSIGNTCWDWH
jgi:transposase